MIGRADLSIQLAGHAYENRVAFWSYGYRVFKLISDHG